MDLTAIKPAEGRRVRDPGTPRMLPIEAGFLADLTDPYWARRLRDGDIELMTPDGAAPAPASGPRLVAKAATE